MVKFKYGDLCPFYSYSISQKSILSAPEYPRIYLLFSQIHNCTQVMLIRLDAGMYYI